MANLMLEEPPLTVSTHAVLGIAMDSFTDWHTLPAHLLSSPVVKERGPSPM
jgi:hypothetical protein